MVNLRIIIEDVFVLNKIEIINGAQDSVHQGGTKI